MTPSDLRRYAIAAGAVALAVVSRYALQGILGDKVPYLQFFPAIVAASWFGGLGPGVLATALSSVAAMALPLPPGGLAVGDAGDALSLAVFAATGVLISWLNHRVHRTEAARKAAAAESSARLERLDAILNTTVDGIIVIDAKGRIEAFNPGAERLFGYPAAEVMGRNVNMLMPAPQHAEHDGYLQRYLTTGEAKIIGLGREVTGRRRDGSLFPVHLSVSEMQIGGQRKFTGMLRDLTRSTTLEGRLGASEARWQAIVDSAVDGIIVIDAHGRVETFNPAAERLFGYGAAEVLGRNVDMLMPSPYREEHDGYLSRYLATGRPKVIGIGREVQGRRKDGTTFPLHLSVGQITINGEHRFTGILHDLSPRVALEERMREQAALAKLGEMAAVVAHEVKNPLAGIRGVMQVFEKRLTHDGASTQVLKDIISRIDSLDQMMKELLLFARPPKPKRARTDVASLVSTTARLLSEDPMWQEVDVVVDGAVSPVQSDPEMLKIVFQNLLINGAHAMQGKGRIRVAIDTVDTMCQIAFSDEGPGIPPEVRDKVFTPFFTTKSRGSGLGLPTAKRFVEAHNGQIAIDCPPDGGTTVVVRLPMDAS
jgi:two-component system sensor kinase FixL